MIVIFIDIYRDRFGLSPIRAVLPEHGISIALSTYCVRRSMPVTAAELEDIYLATRGHLPGELERLRGAQALARNPPPGPRSRTGPGHPADGHRQPRLRHPRPAPHRSEERRVGKECGSRRRQDHEQKNATKRREPAQLTRKQTTSR